MEKKHKVLIRRCDDYDPEKIYGIVKEGMEELGVRPTGRILLKPNVVIAHSEVFPHAFTRKEFLDGVMFTSNGAITHSFVARAESHTYRKLETRHFFDYKPVY